MAFTHRYMVYATNRIMKNKGFTLMELMVVVAITTVISTTLLANYGSFGDKVTLNNLTYDLALTVREAQVYGLSGKFQEQDNFSNVPVILYFNRGGTPLFYMFADANNNWVQDSGENISDYNLGQGYQIIDIWANSDTIKGGINKLAVRFKRPEPDAEIKDFTTNPAGIDYSDVRIIVRSPRGEELSVFVESAGQISVQKITTP